MTKPSKSSRGKPCDLDEPYNESRVMSGCTLFPGSRLGTQWWEAPASRAQREEAGALSRVTSHESRVTAHDWLRNDIDAKRIHRKSMLRAVAST